MASSVLLELLRNHPAIIGLLMMLAIFINVIWIIWCSKAYEGQFFILDTQLKITALWRDYTPCGILSVFSGRRPRGWTRAESRDALVRIRRANREAEAKALAEAVANRPMPKLILKQQPQGLLRLVNKPNKVTNKAIQKSKKTNISQKKVRFMVDDYLITHGLGGRIKMPKRSNTLKENTQRRTNYRRTTFRKINVTYKRPLPPLPEYTFEDKNVKIVISGIYDKYETSHQYEYPDHENSRGRGVPVLDNPLADLYGYEPIGPEPFPYTEELEVFV